LFVFVETLFVIFISRVVCRFAVCFVVAAALVTTKLIQQSPSTGSSSVRRLVRREVPVVLAVILVFVVLRDPKPYCTN
jgi:hypothetical protein